MRASVFLLIAAVAGLLSSLSHAELRTDMYGKQVEVPEVINRVICSSSVVTYLVYTLDPALLAGLNSRPNQAMRSFFTEATLKKPVVGSFGGARNLVNYENILSVAPDLLLHWPAHNTPNKHEEKLVQMGFPLMALNLNTLEHYPGTYRFIGNLLNRAQRGATLADYFTKELDTLKRLRNRIPDAQRVRVYLAEGTDGLLTVTENSVHSEAIRLAGAINVHTQSSFNLRNKERISHEQVLLYAPDVILVQDRHFYASIFKDPRWRQLKAVQKQKVFLIPDFPFSWIDQPPSFLRLLGAKWLVHVLYPDLYPTDFQTDIDYFFGLFFEKKLRQHTTWCPDPRD